MSEKIAFIHTVPILISEFNDLGKTTLPNIEFVHLLDELMLEYHDQQGQIDQTLEERIRSHLKTAEAINPTAIVVTCTIFSQFVHEVSNEFSTPIITIDRALAAQAIAGGATIGLIATNPSTLEPSSQLFLEQAKHIGKTIELKTVFVDEAFELIRKGEAQEHDQLVKAAIFELASSVDIIALAQASMARVLNSIPESDRQVPILSSPHLALKMASKAN